MQRSSFIFYRSFYEALRDLPQNMQGKIFVAIMEYALNSNLVEIDDPIARSIFTLIRPVLDNSLKQYNNGNKGGAPKGNRNAVKKQPKNNPKTTQKQPTLNPKQPEYIQDIYSEKNSFDMDVDKDKDDDVDKDKDVDVDVDVECRARAGNTPQEKKIKDEVKIELSSTVLSAWTAHYRHHYATDYIPDYRSLTTDVATIADAVTKKMGDFGRNAADPKDAADFIDDMLEAMRTAADKWQRDHWNLHTIATQFNDLYNRIINGTSSDNSTNAGITRDYLEQKMRDAFGTV